MGTSCWRKLKVFSMGPPDRMESLVSGCQHLALEKMKVGRKLWAENIKINFQIVWTQCHAVL